ncbi:hypothetical protein BJX96DRAFT_160657 [Aspergillus floccosus]
MEWSSSSLPPPQEDTHTDSFSIDSFLCPQSPAVPGSQPVSSILPNRPYWDFTSVAGFPRTIEPHAWTVNPTGLSGGRNIPPQGGVALTAQPPSAHDDIPAESPDELYAPSSGQPRPDRMGANANTHSAWVAPNSAMSHQQYKAPESIHSPPIFECKWRGCRSATRFSSEGDLVRHLKSIHISPEAYSCRSVANSLVGRITSVTTRDVVIVAWSETLFFLYVRSCSFFMLNFPCSRIFLSSFLL